MSPALLNALIVLVPSLSVAASLGLYWKYRSRGRLRRVAILPLLLCVAFFYYLGTQVGVLLNAVSEGPRVEVSQEALDLHHRSDLPALTQAMLDAGLEGDTIRRILGGNALRVLRSTLPRG